MARTILLLLALSAPCLADTVTIGSFGGAYTVNDVTAFCLNYGIPAYFGTADYTPVNAGQAGIDNLNRIAWIASQSTFSLEDRQRAIWHLTDNFFPFTPGATQLVSLSVGQSYPLDNLTVWVSTIPNKHQTFLTFPGSPIPEPASLVLLGGGLLGMARLLKKKRSGG